MKASTIAVGSMMVLLAGCTTMNHNLDSRSHVPAKEPGAHSTGEIPSLPSHIEDNLKELAGLHDIGFVLVFNKEGVASILKTSESKSRVYKQGEKISNDGIFAVDSIGIVKYLGSHCTGISYRYMDAGIVKEICF